MWVMTRSVNASEYEGMGGKYSKTHNVKSTDLDIIMTSHPKGVCLRNREPYVDPNNDTHRHAFVTLTIPELKKLMKFAHEKRLVKIRNVIE